MAEAPKVTKEEAAAYMEKYNLQASVQDALNSVINSKSLDPLGDMAKFLGDLPYEGRWDMSTVFGNFDVDADGKLDIHEFSRAFRALGLKKRDGSQLDMDQEMFKSFDTNGDGVCDLAEIKKGLKPQTRRKIEAKLDAGWKFDAETWKKSCERHARWDMSKVFKQFDADGDSKLDIYELARAFRALGLPKRDGEKMDVDKAMFKSFDVNGDGFVSLDELEKGLKPKTRKKIEEKLDGGWKFDEATWKASVERHNAYNMKDIFKQFDTDGDSKLTIHEFARAFRAFGLPKRDGSKMEMDFAMFKSFDTNGDGFADLEEIDRGLKPKTRRKIEMKMKEGWKFDEEAWKKSCERHARWDMSKVFKQFDADGDGKLTIHEFARAFRALGLPKRNGEELEMDQAMFKSFDSNGDGFVSLEELEANLLPKTRKKIEEKLDGGWKFDEATWKASCERHARWDMAKVFAQFDLDNDGKIEYKEFMRAFRALGLKKRDGEKMELDQAMFKSFDTNGDGVIDVAEFEANLKPKTRKKIEEMLDGGWTFDAEKWKAVEPEKVGDV